MEQQPEQNGQVISGANDKSVKASVGQLLRCAREAAGLSLAEVTERLKLSPRQLDAIERDDFDMLPGAPFVRGFVRNYARLLDVDPVPLMTMLDQFVPSVGADGMNRTLAEHAGADMAPPLVRDSRKWGVIVGGIVLVVVVGFWIFEQRKRATKEPWIEEVAAPVLAQDDIVRASVALSSAPSSLSLAEASAPTEKIAASSIVGALAAPVANSSPVVAFTPSAPAVTAEARGMISVSTTQLAWVSVTDASGKRLIYSHIEPGSAKKVSGIPPFKIILGNAENVTLNYNDQPVDFSDKIRSDDTVNIEIE